MITLDSREMAALNAQMRRYEAAIPRSVAASALRTSAKPMLAHAKANVPVGRVQRGEGDYKRGGATRKDLRIKTVKGNGKEIGRVLIGVSQKKGRAGWRTHFITQGFTTRKGNRVAGRDFLQSAYDATFVQVSEAFQQELYQRFKKWAQTNLPQSR